MELQELPINTAVNKQKAALFVFWLLVNKNFIPRGRRIKIQQNPEKNPNLLIVPSVCESRLMIIKQQILSLLKQGFSRKFIFNFLVKMGLSFYFLLLITLLGRSLHFYKKTENNELIYHFFLFILFSLFVLITFLLNII